MLPIITFIYPLFGILIMLIILFYGVVTNVSLNFTSKTKHNYLMWALSFGVLAGMYGYTFDYTYNDLFRYAEQIVYYFNGNISTIFTNDSELLYVRDILFHIVSNIGDVHILPFIVGFVTYSIVFYIIFDYLCRLDVSLKLINLICILSIVVSIVTPYSVIGNTRNIFATSIIFLAAYRELIQEKKGILTYILYIVPCGIHSSAFVYIILRLLIKLIQKLKYVAIVISFLIPYVVILMYNILDSINSNFILLAAFKNMIDKAYFYLFSNIKVMGVNSLYTSTIKYYGLICLIIIVVLTTLDKSIFENKYMAFYFGNIICAFTVYNISFGAFWRFEALALMLFPLIVVHIKKKLISDNKYKSLRIEKYLVSCIVISSFFIAYLNSIFQYDDLIVTQLKMCNTSGIKILVECIHQFI